jgi:hypothetical protein
VLFHVAVKLLVPPYNISTSQRQRRKDYEIRKWKKFDVEGFDKLYRTYGDQIKDADMVEREAFVIMWEMNKQYIY